MGDGSMSVRIKRMREKEMNVDYKPGDKKKDN